jgi:hypothetical protein
MTNHTIAKTARWSPSAIDMFSSIFVIEEEAQTNQIVVILRAPRKPLL